MSELEKLPEGVIDFSQFKKKKEDETPQPEPIFSEPTIITLGDPEEPEGLIEYLLIVNLVMNHKQYLALRPMNTEEDGIVVVEGLVEDGQLAGVQVVQTDEEYMEVVEVLQKALETQDALSEGEESSHESDN